MKSYLEWIVLKQILLKKLITNCMLSYMLAFEIFLYELEKRRITFYINKT